jgi:Leucine-rich repeat (LRR) protein
VLDIVNHNMTRLKNNFTTLTALNWLRIQSGPLASLPTSGMEGLTKISVLYLNFNRLTSFNIDVSLWPSLSRLVLSYNNLTIGGDHSIWKHAIIKGLMLNSNLGLALPESADQLYLPQLSYLDISNNSMAIPNYLSSAQLPRVAFLYINGNTIGTIPEEFSTLQSMLMLGIARCKLPNSSTLAKILPLKSLMYVDARDNSILRVGSNVKSMIAENNIESYFSGNPACAIDKDLNCVSLCSRYCYSTRHKDNKFCDLTCDSTECKNDNGECLKYDSAYK